MPTSIHDRALRPGCMNATDADRSAADPAVDHIEQNTRIELAATYLSANPTASPPTVAAVLTGNAAGPVTDPAGGPNTLLYITS
jgi:hypothetical protein